MFNSILIVFFIANALFWGFASHRQHCGVAALISANKCAPHWIHVYVMGLGSFLLALVVSQGKAGM